MMSSNTVANRGCWVGNAFDYVLFHVPRKGLDDIASDLGVGPVETYRVSVLEEDHQRRFEATTDKTGRIQQ